MDMSPVTHTIILYSSRYLLISLFLGESAGEDLIQNALQVRRVAQFPQPRVQIQQFISSLQKNRK